MIRSFTTLFGSSLTHFQLSPSYSFLYYFVCRLISEFFTSLRYILSATSFSLYQLSLLDTNCLRCYHPYKKNYNPNKLFTHWLRTEMYVSLITPQLERLILLSLLVFFSPLSNNPIFFLSNCAQVTARQSRCVEKSLEKLI